MLHCLRIRSFWDLLYELCPTESRIAFTREDNLDSLLKYCPFEGRIWCPVYYEVSLLWLRETQTTSINSKYCSIYCFPCVFSPGPGEFYLPQVNIKIPWDPFTNAGKSLCRQFSFLWYSAPQRLFTLVSLNSDLCFFNSVRPLVSMSNLPPCSWTRTLPLGSKLVQTHLVCFPFLDLNLYSLLSSLQKLMFHKVYWLF